MSLNDFNKRARVDIAISINGTGEFSPFQGETGAPVSWTIDGTVTQSQFIEELTIKEETCGVPFYDNKMFRKFGIFPSSTGGNSGTIALGQIPRQPGPLLQYLAKGNWTVHTEPVLSAGGYANDELIQVGYYIVAQPADKKIDDPIKIEPAIDNLKRVYPGDFVYTQGLNESTKWYVSPQFRYPKPDRTFFWQPNTNPKLESGGIADGELALPGTVMIPTSTVYFENEEDWIDGIKYVRAGDGLMFDGQTWTNNLGNPIVYEPEDGPREFWFEQLGYGSPNDDERRLEGNHYQKPFVYANIPIDDSSTPTYDYTFEGQSQESEGLVFRWGSTVGGYENNIQARSLLYDFGDAWSKYHRTTLNWLKQRFTGWNSAGFTLSTAPQFGEDPKTIFLGVDDFEDGNETVVEQSYTDPEGNVLTNSFTITLSISVYMA